MLLLFVMPATTYAQTCNYNSATLELYSNWDGWASYTYTITNDDGAVKATGTLASTSFGSVPLCFTDDCYLITVSGPSATTDIWWKVRSNNQTIAGGIGLGTEAFAFNSVCDVRVVPNGTFRPLEVVMHGDPYLPTSNNVTTPSSVELYAKAFGGVEPYTKVWTPNTGTHTAPFYEVSPSSTTTYSVQVTDAIGDVVSESVTVTVETIDDVDAHNNPMVWMHTKEKSSTTESFAVCATCESCENGRIADLDFVDNGFTVSATSNSTSYPNMALVFDSENPVSNELDLGTANKAFGGPGFGSGTGNKTAEGNLLILAKDGTDNNSDGIADQIGASPAGGTISLKFHVPVHIEEVTYIDVEGTGSKIELLDQSGAIMTTVNIPTTGNNGAVTINVDYPNVWEMRTILTGDGGFAKFSYHIVSANIMVAANSGGATYGIAAGNCWWGKDDYISVRGARGIAPTVNICGRIFTIKPIAVAMNTTFKLKYDDTVKNGPYVTKNGTANPVGSPDALFQHLEMKDNSIFEITPLDLHVVEFEHLDLGKNISIVTDQGSGGGSGCVVLRACTLTTNGTIDQLGFTIEYMNRIDKGPSSQAQPIEDNLKQLGENGSGNKTIPAEGITMPTSSLVVYPNPFSNQVNFRFIAEADGLYELSVYDSAGKLVGAAVRGSAAEGEQLQLEFAGRNLPAGLYFYRLQAPGKLPEQGKLMRMH